MKPNFFDQGSPYLHHPLLTPQRTKAEIDFVLSLMDLNPGESLLDIGCGAGRHSIELARRGFNVLGIDPSAVMIAAARERAAADRDKPQFLQAKGEDFQWTSQFDASICLFTTLGQVNNGDDNRHLLQNASRALRPGAWLILEVPQRGWTVNHLKTSERIGEGESLTEIEPIHFYNPEEE